jgi:Uma2 family endonuclease
MAAEKREHLLSVEDYLAGERVSKVRHEYLGGRVYAMVGESRRHALIVANLIAALHPQGRQNGCQVFVNDMKVRLQVAGEDVFYYPDLMVTCDPSDRETDYCTRPCLIVEVLSESTERIDRREKLLAYQRLESLETYVLVAQDRRQVEVHRRQEGWRAQRLAEGSVDLGCGDLAIPVAQVYDGVD